MTAFRRTDLLLPVAAALLAWAVSRWEPATPLDLLFGTILLTALLVVLRLLVSAHRQAQAERRRMLRLTVTRPDEVARRAVADERARLSEDISQYVRESMRRVAIRADAAAAEADPRPLLRAIQGDGARTNTELRRQLGLLRDHGPDPSAEPREGGTTTRVLRLQDVLPAGVAVAVAAMELALYPRVTPMPVASPATVLLTVAFCLTLIGRRAHPVAAGLACAGVLVLGTLLAAPVPDGFAFLAVIVGLAWALARTGRRRAWLALALLGAAALGSRSPEEPGNLVINTVAIIVAICGGALVGHQQRARAGAESEATRREQEIHQATAAALLAQRRALARELHDSVSHAMGVVAVQAGAAELCFETDRASARRSIQIIRSTAEQTVSDLDRLRPGMAPARYGLEELLALVQRMRAAGLSVTLTRVGDPPAAAMPTVYRVVQECLTNALRHAPDARVLLEIRTDTGDTVIRVTDDGPGATETSAGYGLVGLRERVSQLGGTIQFPIRPGTGGFEVVVTLPVRADDRA